MTDQSLRRKHRRTKPGSPAKRVLPSDPTLSSEADFPVELDLEHLATPEHAKLKGTIWPGMALFDAATSEMKKKRNQKKDGSVLRKMERLATLVQPFEAVYSPTGELRKERHIDDLEDTSSLIEGETPIPKSRQTRTRKRLPLGEKEPNAPRLVKRKIKTEDSMTAMELGGNRLPPLPPLHSESTIESYSFGPRTLLSEDEDIDIKPRVLPLANRNRPTSFTIFDDGSPLQDRTRATTGGGIGLATAAPQLLSGTSRTHTSTSTALWLPPSHPTPSKVQNPYTSQRHLPREYSEFYHDAQQKENLVPSTNPSVRLGVHTANPLSWRSSPHGAQEFTFATELPYENFLGMFPHPTPSDDPFMATRNPFAEALPHFGLSDSMMIKQD